MPLLRRMHRLHERLFKVRVGPGAVTLPQNVVRIHLLFAKKMNNGHLGPRKFWHEYLPRLKYYNPAVNVIVERVEDSQSPASISVYFDSKNDASDTSPRELQTAGDIGGPKNEYTIDGSERVEHIDIRHSKKEEIYERLLQVTKGRVIEPTEEERAETARYEQEAIDKAIDSKKKKAVMMKLREEVRIERAMREAAKASV